MVGGLFDFNLNSLVSNLYVEASETKSDTIKSSASLDGLKLEKNYGMQIRNVKSCPIFYPGTLERDMRCEKPNKFSTSSQCMNGDCTFTVEFGKTYPQTVGLCVMSGNECTLKYFDVPDEPEVIGYTTTFKLTDELKEALGIKSWEDDIKLEGASGYHANGSFTEGKVYTFSYDYKPTSDSLYVNQEFKKRVKFRNE